MLDQNIIFCKIPDLELSSSTDDPLVLKKQVIYVGSFKKWGNSKLEFEFEVDEDLIDHWVKTHKLLLEEGLDVPFPVHHTDDPEKRRGTVVSLSKGIDSKGRVSLYANVKFNDEASLKQLKNSQVSLYCPPVLRHQDKTFVRPIRHICATDYPVVGDLEPFTIAAAYDAPKPKVKGNSAMMKALAEKLGLTIPPDASDDAIAGMIFAKFEELMKEDIDGDGEVGGEGEDKPDPAVAASNAAMLDLIRDNRSMKIDRLVSESRITPARAKSLKEKFAGKTVSLSNEVFDTVYEELASLEPTSLSNGQSSTGSQSVPGSSVLVANAKARK